MQVCRVGGPDGIEGFGPVLAHVGCRICKRRMQVGQWVLHLDEFEDHMTPVAMHVGCVKRVLERSSAGMRRVTRGLHRATQAQLGRRCGVCSRSIESREWTFRFVTPASNRTSPDCPLPGTLVAHADCIENAIWAVDEMGGGVSDRHRREFEEIRELVLVTGRLFPESE